MHWLLSIVYTLSGQAAQLLAPATEIPPSQGVHWGALSVAEYVPASHAVHTRSAVAEAGVDAYAPALHIVHGVHTDALGVVENPVLHVAHTRSAVAEAGVFSY
jgi:hypothetical protein